MTVASVILPLRHTYIQKPMNMPSGMVMATVNVPHTLSASALTNATPRPASAITRMKRIAIAAMKPDERADLLLDDVGQRLAAAAGRGPQHHRVVDRAGEATSGDEPDEARRVAELRRQHRADQRAGAGDGREVMAEHHPLAGGVVVRAVVLGVRRGLARVVQHPHFRGEERAVVPVGDGQDAERRKQYVQGMHRGGILPAGR